MKYILLLLILFPSVLKAQSAGFKEIRITTPWNDGVDTAIVYPVIVLKNTLAASKINETIRERIFPDEENGKTKSTSALLKRDKEDRHLYVSYEILLNQNAILSFKMFLGASGAYSTDWYEYFNLNTGKALILKDLIQPSKYEAFKTGVFNKKKEALQQYLLDTKQKLGSGEISQDIYDADTAMVMENGCMDSVSLENFHLTNTYLEVHDDCYFPHVLMSEQPYYELQFDLRLLADILKPAILKKLIVK